MLWKYHWELPCITEEEPCNKLASRRVRGALCCWCECPWNNVSKYLISVLCSDNFKLKQSVFSYHHRLLNVPFVVSSDLAGLFYSCTSKLIRVCWPLVNIQGNKINFDCLKSTLSPGEVDADSPGVILPTAFSPACFLSFWPALEADLGISQKIKDFSKPAKSGAAGAWQCKTNHRSRSESRKQCPEMSGKSGISMWDGTGSCCSCLSANFPFFLSHFFCVEMSSMFFFLNCSCLLLL